MQSYTQYADSFRRPSQTPRPLYQHGSISPCSHAAALPFLHSLQPSSWNEDSLFSAQYQDRPSSANSAISNVRGAPNEPKSSPVANRETVIVNDQYADYSNEEAIEATSNHLFGARSSPLPLALPATSSSRFSMKRPAATLLPSAYLASSDGQPQWATYRLNSASSVASLSPSAESAPPMDTPPLLWPDHCDSGSSYTSEGPSSRQPSYFSLPAIHNLSPSAHDDRNRSFSLPSPGLGLMVDETEQAFQAVGRDRASSDGDKDSSSFVQGSMLSANTSLANSPTTSIPSEASLGGSKLPLSQTPNLSPTTYQVPAILAPRPRYASSNSPAFMSASFQYPTAQETTSLNRHALQAFEQQYIDSDASVQWQQSLSAAQHQLVQTYSNSSNLSYQSYGQPAFQRADHCIPLPPAHQNVHPPSHPVYQLQHRRLSQLPTRALSCSSAPRQEINYGYTSSNPQYPPQYQQTYAPLPQMHLRAPSENVEAPQQKRMRYGSGWSEQMEVQEQGSWSYSPVDQQKAFVEQQQHVRTISNNSLLDHDTQRAAADIDIRQSVQHYTPQRQPRQSTTHAAEDTSSSDQHDIEGDGDDSGSYEPEEEAPRRLPNKRLAPSRSLSTARSPVIQRATLPSLPVASTSSGPVSQPSPSASESSGTADWQTRRPPAADFTTADDSMMPRQQKTRFADDVYTPKWIRGKGVNKEGYCSICPTGQWLRLKTSAFWYHKQYTHGISSTSGYHFMPPVETRPTVDGSVEGFCHSCSKWQKYQTKKQSGTTKVPALWCKHAFKCHSAMSPPRQSAEAEEDEEEGVQQ